MLELALNYLLLSAKYLAWLFIFYAFLFASMTEAKRYGIDKLPIVRLFFAALGVLFVICDWWVNVVISLLFLDPPGTPLELVTGRLQRYKGTYGQLNARFLNWRERYRLRFALWTCQRLNRFDPDHC